MAHLVITGASTGIGRAVAVGLADRFDRVTVVGRDPIRHQATLAAVAARGAEPRLVEADLGSLRSVAQAASQIAEGVDVLVANAGVAGSRGTTEDGFERHFGVNHLAHHLLTTALADQIRQRVVVVSSNAHFEASGLNFDTVVAPTRSLTGMSEYRVSKLANVLFGRVLAERRPFVTAVVHPGVVATDIWRRIPWPIRPLVTRRMITPEQGAVAVIAAAVDAGVQSGGYYSRRELREPSRAARDDALAAELWERSENWVRPFREAS